MAIYIFETMTADNASNFDGSADQLIFANPNNTAYNLAVSNSGGLNLTTLTGLDGTSRTFAAAQIAAASAAGRLSFSDGSDATIVIGTAASDTQALGVGVSADAKAVFHGFAGGDTITTNDGNSIVFGGAGGDTISGGNGNDHLYGFGLTGDPSVDGNDSISGGAGNDYIQGNAGDDTLAGDDGNDRIHGGQGNDTISGGDGHDVINGNKGNDSISGGDGNDVIRGGQGNDRIEGNDGNDILLGDLGNDTLTGGAGIDVMTGGEGNDVFVFATGDAGFATSGPLAGFVDQITDFTIGQDRIDLGGMIGASSADILHVGDGASFTSVDAARIFAQQLIDNAGIANAGANLTAVAAIQIGSDTYLFYDDNGVDGVINATIKLDGVVAADFKGDSIFA